MVAWPFNNEQFGGEGSRRKGKSFAVWGKLRKQYSNFALVIDHQSPPSYINTLSLLLSIWLNGRCDLSRELVKLPAPAFAEAASRRQAQGGASG